MKIGPLFIENPLVLAPMAGFTDYPFRRIARRAGAGLVCAEMISAKGLVYGSGRTREMLFRSQEETPLSIQIFGSEPDVMADAAIMVEEAGADVIDINFGCSVRKILKSNAGSALMADPGLAEKIIRHVRKAVSIPLTIKMRSGWEASGDQAIRLARIAEDCGADAVCIHPRTARQGFSGKADWSLIRRVKLSVSIPVIGNGDVVRPEDVSAMMEQTGCDAVMIGRAAMGNPWIFGQALAHLKNETPVFVSIKTRFATMRKYLDDAISRYGEYRACRIMRSRLSRLAKGLPGASDFRKAVTKIESRNNALELLRQYEKDLCLMDHGPECKKQAEHSI